VTPHIFPESTGLGKVTVCQTSGTFH